MSPGGGSTGTHPQGTEGFEHAERTPLFPELDPQRGLDEVALMHGGVEDDGQDKPRPLADDITCLLFCPRASKDINGEHVITFHAHRE